MDAGAQWHLWEQQSINSKHSKTWSKTFNTGLVICIVTDWSKKGFGFCLLKKKCDCVELTPVCCIGGWVLVMCSSRYTTSAESRYSLAKEECLGVVWALKKVKYFMQSCEWLIIAVDHKPLLGILGDRVGWCWEP